MTNTKKSIKVVAKAIFGNLSIAILKFLSWIMSPNPSMLAEAIHSLADTLNQTLLYIGIAHGEQGPTRQFPLGQGRARYVWNLISAVGIFFIGFGITAYHGVQSLFHPPSESTQTLNFFSLGILFYALVVDGYVFMAALKDLLRNRGDQDFWDFIKNDADPTILAVVFEDGVAVLGVLLAALGLYLSYATGSPLPDAIVTLLIALLLGTVALVLGFSNAQLLIGKSLSQNDELELKRFIESLPQVEKVASIKTSIIGPYRTLLTAEIEIHGSTIIDKQQLSKDAERLKDGEEPLPILVDTAERTVRILGNSINLIEKKIKEEFPDISTIDLIVN